MAHGENHEMFRYLPWPFPEGRFPRALGAVVMRSVLDGKAPALQVVHFPNNDWAFADGVGDPNEEGATTVAHIWHVLKDDATLHELASLPPGFVADRQGVGHAWVITPFEWQQER